MYHKVNHKSSPYTFLHIEYHTWHKTTPVTTSATPSMVYKGFNFSPKRVPDTAVKTKVDALAMGTANESLESASLEMNKTEPLRLMRKGTTYCVEIGSKSNTLGKNGWVEQHVHSNEPSSK